MKGVACNERAHETGMSREFRGEYIVAGLSLEPE